MLFLSFLFWSEFIAKKEGGPLCLSIPETHVCFAHTQGPKRKETAHRSTAFLRPKVQFPPGFQYGFNPDGSPFLGPFFHPLSLPFFGRKIAKSHSLCEERKGEKESRGSRILFSLPFPSISSLCRGKDETYYGAVKCEKQATTTNRVNAHVLEGLES